MSDNDEKMGQIPNEVGSEVGSTNRGLDTIFTGKSLTITLEKINKIIIEHLKNVIIPTIDDNGVSIPVPIIYGDGERWAQIQKEGYIRDPQSDKLSCPIIMIRRKGVKPSKLNNPNNKYVHEFIDTGFNARNTYDKFAVLNGIIPSKRIRQVIVPDYYDIDYELVLWTEKQYQMDQLLEQISVENYEFWGNRNNFKFRVSIDQFQGEGGATRVEVRDRDTRMVRSEFSMAVSAYLLPERMVKNFKMSSTNEDQYTYKKIVMKEKFVDDISQIEEP